MAEEASVNLMFLEGLGVQKMGYKTLREINLRKIVSGRTYHPSPSSWEDQVIYFLMVDRFSDGRETEYLDNEGRLVTTKGTPRYTIYDADNAIKDPQSAARWRSSGSKWNGGNLRGLQSKIGYLRRLGVTAIWLSPCFKQVCFEDTYHGYGTQNFLEIDPHFGTREDLKQVVQTAHEHGLYVILDVILNHTGNVFSYKSGDLGPKWTGDQYPVVGFHDDKGNPELPFAPIDIEKYPDAYPEWAVWPKELQKPEVFTRKGRIEDWDNDPEFREGDFFNLKDMKLGEGDIENYKPSKTLWDLCEIYKYWIAYTDLDGFRIDTVKHMDDGATRIFASVIHEFAESIGKENFYMIGEIAGTRKAAVETMEATGLDAALGIAEIPDKLEGLARGVTGPAEYFRLFKNSLLVGHGSHTWFKNKIVTVLDDHDQIRKGTTNERFCAHGSATDDLVVSVTGLQATSMGIPCIYYGTEQGFDGEGGADHYIRECMFGGDFGPFRSQGRHTFLEDSRLYREISNIFRVRREHIALRRGRQYLREISMDNEPFAIPEAVEGAFTGVFAWSRIFAGTEMVMAMNNDRKRPYCCDIRIDEELCTDVLGYKFLYSTRNLDHKSDGLLKIGTSDGFSFILEVCVPPAGFVILAPEISES